MAKMLPGQMVTGSICHLATKSTFHLAKCLPGQLVTWPNDYWVKWSPGLLVTRSVVNRSNGHLVKWLPGQLVTWPNDTGSTFETIELLKYCEK